MALSISLASFIKSAQFIFYKWLPDSMEAPLPASALIHSATLVSAGIYLMIKFKNIFTCDILNQILLLITLITLLCSALIACY